MKIVTELGTINIDIVSLAVGVIAAGMLTNPKRSATILQTTLKVLESMKDEEKKPDENTPGT